MDTALRSYLDRCEAIFNEKQCKPSNRIVLPGTRDLSKENKHLFEETIKEAENTSEFEIVVRIVGDDPLAADLERFVKKDKIFSEKQKKRLPDLVKRRKSIARLAAQAFFRNTDTYYKLWHGLDLNIKHLVKILNDYPGKGDSEVIRLMVFDGFSLYNGKEELETISLPVGKIRWKRGRRFKDNL